MWILYFHFIYVTRNSPTHLYTWSLRASWLFEFRSDEFHFALLFTIYLHISMYTHAHRTSAYHYTSLSLTYKPIEYGQNRICLYRCMRNYCVILAHYKTCTRENTTKKKLLNLFHSEHTASKAFQ